MRTRGAKAFVLFAVLAAWVTASSGGEQSNDIAIVVNQNNLIVNVSAAELKKIFAGERLAWPSGVPVKLLTRGPGAREHACLLKLLRMTESEYEQYWKDRSGTGFEAPVALPSNGVQKEVVQAFRGAIAMVQMSDVRSSMRVIKVDGRPPNQNGYPLH